MSAVMEHAEQAGHRTPAEVRSAIQQSGESIRSLARRYGVNPKTVAKWRRRNSVEDRKAGPRNPRSSALSVEEEAIVVAFRQHVRLSLDGCLQALRGLMPQLSRSSLHRCLHRHGISRLPSTTAEDEQERRAGQVCFDIGFSEIRANKCYQLWVAVERDSHFVHAELYESAGSRAAAEFVQALIKAAPCEIDSVVTDEGAPAEQLEVFRDSGFAQVCADGGIVHRAERARQRWTSEQIERMHGTMALAARRWRLGMAPLRRKLGDALLAYNSRCALEILGGQTPVQCIGIGIGIGPRQPAPASNVRTTGSRDMMPGARSEARKAGAAAKPRRVPDPATTREAILQAARSCLAHDGPEGLSLAEVARIAGVNRGTAYQHFKTRDKLIAATAEGVSEKLFHAVFGAVGATRDRRVGSIDIAALTDRLTSFAMDNPELCRAWLINVLSSPEPASDLFWREYQSSGERFDSTELSQNNVDTEVLSVIMLAGIFLWPVWARAQYKGSENLRAQAQRFAEESLRISMYGNLRPERYPDIAKRLAERRIGRDDMRNKSGQTVAAMTAPLRGA